MTLRFSSCTHFFKFLQVIVISGYIATLQDELYTLERNHISKVKFLSFEIFFKHCPFLDGLNPIAIKGIAISLQALINISLGFISCSFQVDNVRQRSALFSRVAVCYQYFFNSHCSLFQLLVIGNCLFHKQISFSPNMPYYKTLCGFLSILHCHILSLFLASNLSHWIFY